MPWFKPALVRLMLPLAQDITVPASKGMLGGVGGGGGERFMRRNIGQCAEYSLTITLLFPCLKRLLARHTQEEKKVLG